MKRTLKTSQKFSIEGSYVIRTYKAGTKELLWESPRIKNRVVLGTGYGRNIIIRQLSADTTYSIAIDSASIGTGTTTPADSDTNLVTPVTTGIAVADRTIGTNTTDIIFFVADAALANGTYKEFGIFCNLRLFARSLITPNFTKGSNQDTTFTYTLTLNAA